MHTIIDMMRLDYAREVNHHGQVRKVGNDSKGMERKLLKTLQMGQQTKALSAQSQTTPFIVFADWRLQGRAGIGSSILIKFGQCFPHSGGQAVVWRPNYGHIESCDQKHDNINLKFIRQGCIN